jgi:hypothetical protein
MTIDVLDLWFLMKLNGFEAGCSWPIVGVFFPALSGYVNPCCLPIKCVCVLGILIYGFLDRPVVCVCWFWPSIVRFWVCVWFVFGCWWCCDFLVCVSAEPCLVFWWVGPIPLFWLWMVSAVCWFWLIIVVWGVLLLGRLSCFLLGYLWMTEWFVVFIGLNGY